MAATYEPIASTTISGSSTSTVTFDNLAGTFTDIVCVGLFGDVSANSGLSIRMNNDTGSNYSNTRLYGNGSSANSARRTNAANVYVGGEGIATTAAVQHVFVTQVMSYANTNVYTTWLNAEGNAGTGVSRSVGLWRNTAAVTRLDFTMVGQNFSDGSVISLYGIKAA